MGKPVKITMVTDSTDAVRGFEKANKAAEKTTDRFDSVAESSDRVASKGAQAAGALSGLGDLVGGKFGAAMQTGGIAMQAAADSGDLLNVVTESNIVKKVKDTAVTITQTAATKAKTVADKASAVAMKVAAAAQRALNFAMVASPIGLIVIAVVALVAGFVLLYNKSEKVRQITKKVGEALKPVGDFLKTVMVKYLKLVASLWLTMGIVAIKALKGLLTAAFLTFEGILKAADKGLGWIPGIGGKIKKAKNAFVDFKDGTIGALDKVEGKLATTRDKVNQLGRAKAKPKIDTSSIDTANTKLSVMLQRLRAIGANLTADILEFGSGSRTSTSGTTSGRIAPYSIVGLSPAPAGVQIDQLVLQVPVGGTAEDIGREFVGYIQQYYNVGGERL